MSWPGATEGEAHSGTALGHPGHPGTQLPAWPGGTLRVARAIEAQGPAVVSYFLGGVVLNATEVVGDG